MQPELKEELAQDAAALGAVRQLCRELDSGLAKNHNQSRKKAQKRGGGEPLWPQETSPTQELKKNLNFTAQMVPFSDPWIHHDRILLVQPNRLGN